MIVDLRVHALPEGISLGKALEATAKFLAAGEAGATALLYDPEQCCFGRLVEDGAIQWGRRGPDGSFQVAEAGPIDLEAVYEARVFSEAGELRWLNGQDGVCRAVLITEHAKVPGFDREPIETLPEVEPREVTYLLWGKGTGEAPAAGWSELATARIGPLVVPTSGPVARDRRVRLKGWEYFHTGEHGNVTVIEERLIGLEVGRG